MQSVAPLATLLFFVLWAPMSGADSGALNAHAEASTAVLESTYGSPASEESSLAGMIPTPALETSTLLTSTEGSEGFSELLQSLSPLPVMALGILGLFWVRRHTAEL